MSANYDKNQKFKFVSENVYQITPRQNPNPNQSANPKEKISKTIQTSGVLKAEDLNKAPFAAIRINPYTAAEMIGKRIARPSSLPPVLPPVQTPVLPQQSFQPQAQSKAAPAATQTSSSAITQGAALKSMKENLKVLNDLQARLRFVLKELENLIQD